jgi:hypothetical protein
MKGHSLTIPPSVCSREEVIAGPVMSALVKSGHWVASVGMSALPPKGPSLVDQTWQLRPGAWRIGRGRLFNWQIEVR